MIARLTLCATMLLAAVDARGDQQSKQPAPPANTAKAAEGTTTKAKSKEVELRPVEENILKHTNSARAKFGLASLEIDHDLMQSARQHAKWMAQNHNLVHTSRPVAENIAMGQENSKEAVGCWMNSSGHRANILNRWHRRIGVASARNGNGTVFWCQQFR